MSTGKELKASNSIMLSSLARDGAGRAAWSDDTFLKKDPGGLPLPPDNLMQYGETPERHLHSGRRDGKRLLDIMKARSIGGNVLELGCGIGRVTRWFREHAEQNEVWGVDINAEAVMWAALHLHPIQFCTMSTYAGLPFRDGFFGFAYAYSVFAHMDEAFTFWLQEMRRLLAPGGYLFVTVLDENAVRYAREADRKVRIVEVNQPGFVLDGGKVGLHLNKHGVINTYIDSSALARLTERSFETVDVVHKTMGGIQTGYLFRRR